MARTKIAFGRFAGPAIALAFVLWALAYIYRSSFIAIDGQRYFGLFDDAMISMRYAWNYSHGLGLVWNAGERVEGYTNFLMVLLMSAATRLLDKSSAVLAVQLAGIPTMVGAACIAARLTRFVARSEVTKDLAAAELVVFVGVLLYYPLSFWTLTGMETGLLALLLVSAVYFSLRYLESARPGPLMWMAWLLGLAFLTRNDSLIYAVIVLAFTAFQSRSAGRGWTALLPALGVFTLFVLGQQVFRYSYYHAWVPNTYTLKMIGMPLLDRLRNGGAFIGPFLVETGAPLLLATVGVLFGGSTAEKYLLGLFWASALYQVGIGGEPWDRWRMMSAVMPFAVVVFSAQGMRLARGMTKARSGRRLAASLLIVGGLLLADVRFLPEMLLRVPGNADNLDQMNLAIAVDELTRESATVGVFHAGLLPYYTGRRAIDFLGKSDAYIAGLPPHFLPAAQAGGHRTYIAPGHNKYDLSYSIKQLRPTYVEGFNWYTARLERWARSFYLETSYESVELYLLKDSPDVLWELAPAAGSP